MTSTTDELIDAMRKSLHALQMMGDVLVRRGLPRPKSADVPDDIFDAFADTFDKATKKQDSR